VQAAIEATEDALACQPAAVELIDRTILELSRQKLEYRALGSILHGDPEALLFVTFTGDTQAEAAAGLDRLDGRWRAHGHGYPLLRAVGGGGEGGRVEGPPGGAGPAQGGRPGPPQAAGVRRGPRRGAGRARRLRPPVPADPGLPRPAGRLLRPRLGRVPARPAVHGPQRTGAG